MLGRVLLGAAIGVVAGSLIGWLGRSLGGACPILCKPTVSAIFFGVIGAVIAAGVGGRGGKPALDELKPIASAQELRDQVLAVERPALVEFYADWCGACRRLAPVVNGLAKEYGERATFAKVDVDKAGELAREYGIQGVPTTVLFARGKEVKRFVGATWKAELQKELDALLSG